MALADPPADAGPKWGELWGVQCDVTLALDQAIEHFTAKRRRIQHAAFAEYLTTH